jgi:hypothetical protein
MEPSAASAATLLDEHARCTPVTWRVGDLDVALRTKVGVRGHPGVDGALVALGEALRRGRAGPPAGASAHPGAATRALDLTGAPAAMPLWAAAAGVDAEWTVALSSAAALSAAREALGDAPGATARATVVAALPWEVSGPFDSIVWRPPADRGVQPRAGRARRRRGRARPRRHGAAAAAQGRGRAALRARGGGGLRGGGDGRAARPDGG